MCLAIDRALNVPAKLRHRLLLENSAAESPEIGTSHTPLHVLARPIVGSGWTADDGPSLDSHHRVGVLVAGGLAQISRRFAVDWKITRQGVSFAGDARDVHSYFSYGKELLAVADAVVVRARDGLPDNIPRTAAGFSTAVPITAETLAGNSIALDLGGGEFAVYAHMQPGSLTVKTGDHVRRGQLIGRIGNSGRRCPRAAPAFSVRLLRRIFSPAKEFPYLIDRYRAKGTDGDWQERKKEFPLGPLLIDFGD